MKNIAYYIIKSGLGLLGFLFFYSKIYGETWLRIPRFIIPQNGPGTFSLENSRVIPR